MVALNAQLSQFTSWARSGFQPSFSAQVGIWAHPLVALIFYLSRWASSCSGDHGPRSGAWWRH